MAEKIEPEVVEIFKHIKKCRNFILSGGAGSGKTYSLVQVIKQVINLDPKIKIACITYTNAAVKEIEGRVNHSNLSVSTIHDFLWDNIKNFQKELKESLIALMNDVEPKIKKPYDDFSIKDLNELDDGIQYKEYLRIKEGVVSHDEVLILANYMFKNNPLLCDILIDKFGYIFIDEYQDTHPKVVEIFMEFLNTRKKKNIIGFFGDSMQSIYDDGIGDLNEFVSSNKIEEVVKNQNRRNPQLVINLANDIRTDNIKQTASKDVNAPNMINNTIKNGSILFLYSDSDKEDFEFLINENKIKYFNDWDFLNSKETKVLNLTHNLIAEKGDFKNLFDIYDKDPIIKLKNDLLRKINFTINDSDTFEYIVDKVALKRRGKNGKFRKDEINEDERSRELFNQLKDKPFSEIRKMYLTKDALIDDKKQDSDEESRKGSKRDNLIKHLFKIQNTILLYKQKKYNEFIKKTDFPLVFGRSKNELKEVIESLVEVGDQTIEEIINKADKKGICIKDEKFSDFVKNNTYLFNQVKKIKFKEFQNLYKYLEGNTPFSTQHKIKGEEYKNVIVLLDNGGWSKYNFEYLFTNKKDKESVINRTKKLFYVCCTRAMDNLVVFYHSPNKDVLKTAKEWFGVDNVKKV